jgi:hypothetical protein
VISLAKDLFGQKVIISDPDLSLELGDLQKVNWLHFLPTKINQFLPFSFGAIRRRKRRRDRSRGRGEGGTGVEAEEKEGGVGVARSGKGTQLTSG